MAHNNHHNQNQPEPGSPWDDARIEAALRQLTRQADAAPGTEPGTELVDAALASERRASRQRHPLSFREQLGKSFTLRRLAVAACVGLMVLATSSLLYPAFSRSRSSATESGFRDSDRVAMGEPYAADIASSSVAAAESGATITRDVRSRPSTRSSAANPSPGDALLNELDAGAAISIDEPASSSLRVAAPQAAPSADASTAEVNQKQSQAIVDASQPDDDEAFKPLRNTSDRAATGAAAAPSAAPAAAAPPVPRQPRLIVREGSMSICVEALDPAIASVRSLIHAELGEFVESAQRTSDEQATLVLKVTSHRVHSVLHELTQLGSVTAEQISGRDATAQAVDLDARIRNAERVERELLDLLESRRDQPLRDVLDLQRELAEARQQIEQLIAQRDALHQLAALATLRVKVFVEPAVVEPVEEPDQGFIGSLHDAWSDGVAGLQRSLELLVRVIVGGAILWAALTAVVVIGWRACSRQQAYAA